MAGFEGKVSIPINKQQDLDHLKIEELTEDLKHTYHSKRDGLCAVCFAVVARHGKPMVTENQYKLVVGHDRWSLALATERYLVSDFRSSAISTVISNCFDHGSS